jgi:hypothetical protein
MVGTSCLTRLAFYSCGNATRQWSTVIFPQPRLYSVWKVLEAGQVRFHSTENWGLRCSVLRSQQRAVLCSSGGRLRSVRPSEIVIISWLALLARTYSVFLAQGPARPLSPYRSHQSTVVLRRGASQSRLVTNRVDHQKNMSHVEAKQPQSRTIHFHQPCHYANLVNYMQSSAAGKQV